jgi:C4-dicarboxylate transporter
MKMNNQFERIKKESEEIKTEIKQRIVGYIVAAFSLVAGLAWNEAVKSLIEYIFPLSSSTLLLKFVYAIFITLVLVFVSIYLVKLLKVEEGNK